MARESKKNKRQEAPLPEVAEEKRPGLRTIATAWFMNIVRSLWAYSWVLSIIIATLLALSLGTYSQDDPAFTLSTDRMPTNFCGALGAKTADLTEK